MWILVLDEIVDASIISQFVSLYLCPFEMEMEQLISGGTS